MKKFLALITTFVFLFTMTANTNIFNTTNSDVNGIIITKTQIENIDKDVCKVEISVWCDGDTSGPPDYNVIVDCEYADAMGQQLSAGC